MGVFDELVEHERAAWQALSSGGDAAVSFFASALAHSVLFILPGDLVIDDRAAAIESMSGTPWGSFRLSGHRVRELTDDCALIAYRVQARRGGDEYVAWCSSTYVREKGAWRMAVHQQSPG